VAAGEADRRGLAVEEDVRVAGREVERRDRLGEALVGVAVQPVQVEVAGALQPDLLLGAVDLEEDVDGGAGRDLGERGGNRRDHAGVAGHQVPGGRRVGGVAAAGPAQVDRVAGAGRRRPGAGDALVAVDDEVDRQQAPVGVPVAHRVGADLRPLVLRRAVARELQLHVVVGVLPELELGEPVATEDDPGQGRGERLDRLHPGGEQRAVTGASVIWFGGDGRSFSLRVP
jgi:hypothetical protein